MYPMFITINAQPQMSFEQFQEIFREAFGRDMTQDERKWLWPVFPQPDLNAEFLEDAAA